MRKIKSGDILIFNSTKPHNTFKLGDRVIFRGWMYLEGAKRSYGTVDFGSRKNLVCDMSLFITLEELRENRINQVLEFSE
jgi:hypothetical protein